jgi:hypothetical protein
MDDVQNQLFGGVYAENAACFNCLKTINIKKRDKQFS